MTQFGQHDIHWRSPGRSQRRVLQRRQARCRNCFDGVGRRL